jgi:hypothetical protein
MNDRGNSAGRARRRPSPAWSRLAPGLALIWVLAAAPRPATACEAGVADGTVTIDGRPLLWKLRVQVDVPNDVHWFAAGHEHYPGLGPALYSYLGVGPHDDAAEGPARAGVNAAGLAIGFNAYHDGDWKLLEHHALGFGATTTAVAAYVLGLTNLGTIHYAIDAGGRAVLWENDRDPSGHWTYDTRATARIWQWRDFDGDGDTVPYAGWVGRANAIDRRTDGMDEPRAGESDRTAAAQTVPGRLVDSGGLSVRRLATEYFRHDALAVDTSVAGTIVHGVLPGEDARLTTMWTALGHPEGAIFVPVWLLGVETGDTPLVPDYLDFGDGDCAYVPAKGLISRGVDEATLQTRTLPVEARFFALVLDELLPAWRTRDWQDPAQVTATGREMRRVQTQLDADAYSLLDCLYCRDQGNRAPLGSGIDGWQADGLTVSLAATARDDDGAIADAHWDYGDGHGGTAPGHTYEAPGTYLVGFTATDDDGVSLSDWTFVTVAPDGAAAAGPSLPPGAGPASVACHPNPAGAATVVRCRLRGAGPARLTVFDLQGRRVRALAGWPEAAAGSREVAWDGRDEQGRSLPGGVYLCVLEAGGSRVASRVTLIR